MRLLVLFCFSLMAVGCTTVRTEKSSCFQRDWYELGRRDGSQGQSNDKVADYKKECAAGFNTQAETLYSNGRNAGLVEFCDPDNGFDLGRMGITYQHVCPSIMETDFMTAYGKGQKARSEEFDRRDLDRQVDEETETQNDSRL